MIKAFLSNRKCIDLDWMNLHVLCAWNETNKNCPVVDTGSISNKLSDVIVQFQSCIDDFARI